MRENNVRLRSDRSYFCLVAIYAIHALLLNVIFPQATLNAVQSSLSLRSGHVLDSRAGAAASSSSSFSIANANKNMSKTGSEFVGDPPLDLSSRTTNATQDNEMKNISVARRDEDHLRKLPTRAFSQSKSGGAAIHFVSILKTSNVLKVTNNAIDRARSIIERLTPAALGIISGCLVFFVTFTENYRA